MLPIPLFFLQDFECALFSRCNESVTDQFLLLTLQSHCEFLDFDAWWNEGAQRSIRNMKGFPPTSRHEKTNHLCVPGSRCTEVPGFWKLPLWTVTDWVTDGTRWFCVRVQGLIAFDVEWTAWLSVLLPAKAGVSNFNRNPRAILSMTKKHLACWTLSNYVKCINLRHINLSHWSNLFF